MDMTRRTMLAAGAAVMATRATAGWAQPVPGTAGRGLSGRVDAVVATMVRDHGFQGVVMFGRAGTPLLSRAVGQADIEHNRALTPATPFGIGSISKRLTATAIMRLVERGRLALDAPITTYLPDYRADTGARITLRRLLSNSSGVPNQFTPAIRADPTLFSMEMSTTEAIRRFASGDFAFEPGARFDYVLTNWIIVLGIIEAVTGRPYAQAMRELVTAPLRLASTSLDVTPGIAKSYRTLSPPTEWTDVRLPYRMASGGYFSTATDLLRFAHLVYDTAFLTRASRAALTHVEVASDTYALGGRVRTVTIGAAPVQAAWDTGNVAGFRSVLGHRLDGRGTVAILNNTAMSQRTMDEFAEALMRAPA